MGAPRTRVSISRRTLPNGTVVEKRKVVTAPILEWVLQAAQVRALRDLPEYDVDFTLAGGMEAGKRGPQEQVRAKATGLTSGHPDVTIFMRGGRVGFIENKGEKTPVTQVQKDRHALLRSLGFEVEVIRSSTEAEAALACVQLVQSWMGLPANDNTDRAQLAALGRRAWEGKL